MKTIQLGGGGGVAECIMKEEGMHQFKLIIIYCIIPSRDRQLAISSITVMEQDHQHSPRQKSTGQPNKNRIYVFLSQILCQCVVGNNYSYFISKEAFVVDSIAVGILFIHGQL